MTESFMLHNRAQHRASAGDPLWRQRTEITAERSSVAASSDLAEAMRQSFERFERRHRLRPGEGRILLMDTGVRR